MDEDIYFQAFGHAAPSAQNEIVLILEQMTQMFLPLQSLSQPFHPPTPPPLAELITSSSVLHGSVYKDGQLLIFYYSQPVYLSTL